MVSKSHLRTRLFQGGVILKGLDGLIEVAGGIALLFATPSQLRHLVHHITYNELAEDPHDFIANHLRQSVSHFTLGSEHFMAIYLLGHGILKLLLVYALLKRKLWAFPTAIVIFTGLIGYQIFRYTQTHSLVLMLLTVIDAIVIWFVWLEYRALRSTRARH